MNTKRPRITMDLFTLKEVEFFQSLPRSKWPQLLRAILRDAIQEGRADQVKRGTLLAFSDEALPSTGASVDASTRLDVPTSFPEKVAPPYIRAAPEVDAATIAAHAGISSPAPAPSMGRTTNANLSAADVIKGFF